MALPQKVADQLARSPEKTPGGFRQLFFLSSTIFSISLAIYLGLNFGYRAFYLEPLVEELRNETENLANQISVTEQVNIVNFHSQLVNLQNILKNHTPASLVFDWLERNTQVNVYFERFDFRSSGNIFLSGVAKTKNDLSEQILAFENLKEIKEIKLSGVSVSEKGLWRFDAALTPEPNFFEVSHSSTTP